MRRRARKLIPEVIQTSATDCGPASMKAVLAGLGLDLDYRALREACQTDVDGSSVDTLEELAKQLGLDAEQIMLPLDHVFLREAHALPAIIVTLTPGGRPHFVVLWRCVGRFVQVMDPATGRHWLEKRTLMSRLYEHTTAVPAAAWREWAGSDEASATFERRLVDIGARNPKALTAAALADRSHAALAALDAATRAVEAMIRARAVRRGPTAASLLCSMLEGQRTGTVLIPESYWSVLPNPSSTGETPELLLRGAVLLRFRGAAPETPAPGSDAVAPAERAAGHPPPAALAPDMAAALATSRASAWRTLLELVREEPASVPVSIAVALVLTTGGRILQAVMLRALLDLGRDLGTLEHRVLGMVVFALVALLVLLLQVPVSLGLLGIGRRLEVRMRKAYFEKLPQIEDRYFQSRLASDMASRCHAIQAMRSLPSLLGQGLTITLEALTTAGALIWIAPSAAGITVGLLAVTLLLPLLGQSLFTEPDMRVQAHGGALSAFTLNALLGLTPIRIHGAERSLRRGQEALLVEWTRARHGLQQLSLVFEALLSTSSFGLVAWLVFAHVEASDSAALVLLVVFWALRFPVLGQRLLVLTRSVPSVMNRVRRLLEMIGEVPAGSEPSRARELTAPAPAPLAPAAPLPSAPSGAPRGEPRGVGVRMQRVRVKGGGHVILDKVSLDIAPGEHVAIVGSSGAGKSTLVGLLLGWLRPCRGELSVDGRPFDQAAVERLRRETAWIDPSIQLWNESLLDNLRYGNDASEGWSLGGALEAADMLDILDGLPEGLQTQLGEGGGLVSGGQGQRVRLARAMLRSSVRLAILDEPFRGLDRERRARLLREARRRWAQATLLCVTHDVSQTTAFDRVLVVEGGRVVEDGAPGELCARATSRYAALLRADEHNHRLLWNDQGWRRWWLSDGQLSEQVQA